jgi:hypothetical protein
MAKLTIKNKKEEVILEFFNSQKVRRKKSKNH